MEERCGDTRERILQAARKLFTTYGFHETSMSRIARESGLGKGTLYWHFDSKEELFNEMLNKQVGESVKALRQVIEQDIPYQEILRKIVQGSLRGLEENRKDIHILLSKEHNFTSETRQNLFQLYQSIQKEICHFFEKGIKQGILVDESPEYMASAFLGMIHSMGSNLKTDRQQKEEMGEFIYKFIIKGLMVNKDD